MSHKVPHKMRTLKEWLEIANRVAIWAGGVRNGNRRQCAVCFKMYEPKKGGNNPDAKYCCRHCRNTARTARAHAAKLGGIYYTPRKAVETIYDAASGSGAFIMANPPFKAEVRNA